MIFADDFDTTYSQIILAILMVVGFLKSFEIGIAFSIVNSFVIKSLQKEKCKN